MTTFQKIIATVVLMLTVLGAMVFLSWRRDVEYKRCLEFLRKAPEGITSSKCVDIVFRRELQLESSKPTPRPPKLRWKPKPTP